MDCRYSGHGPGDARWHAVQDTSRNRCTDAKWQEVQDTSRNRWTVGNQDRGLM